MAPETDPHITELAFRGEFRRYQQTVLAGMQAALENDRHHIVAPPGSGKTILGLELLHRLGTRAVVFAPTTVIQRQWLETLERFVPDGADVAGWASTEADADAPIGVFTYQLIAAPDAANDALDAMALERWRGDLASGDVAASAAEAEARIATIRESNAEAYRKELARRRQELRRELLRADPSAILELLHPNARELIERIAARGVRTIVLDECHHLLDYWAIVLRALVGRLDHPRVVGLTATLPDLESTREYENYVGLVGDVDFETPVPAVVREGHLAPYRDLALFVQPTERERRWLDEVGEELARAVDDVTGSARFDAWLHRKLAMPLRELLDQHGPLLVAALRWLAATGTPWPDGLELPTELDGAGLRAAPTLDDRIQLLAAYMLDELATSGDDADHRELARLRGVLRAFGATVTERGLRRSRSPGDLLLAASDARADGAARILQREHEALGDELRAVCVTDFDRDRSGVQIVDDVIGARAGGARRVASRLAADAQLAGLGVVLVTGQLVAVDAAHAAAVRDACLSAAASDQLELTIELGEELDGLVPLAGSGRDWRPGVYVPLVTGAFTAGEVRVLVGTRALLGEGWDAPAANVLVDLTSVASPQSVQQLRGRTMRIDPTRPDKVAHNWDVVCIDPRSESGNPDLRRFVRRHERLWGITPAVPDRDLARTIARISRTPTGLSLAPAIGHALRQRVGAVESGLAHVDPLLEVELGLLGSWTDADFDAASRRSLDAVDDRFGTRERWQVGSRFDDEIREGARLRPPSNAPITSQTMRRIALPLLLALFAAVTTAFYVWAYVIARLSADGVRADEVPGGGWILLAGLVALTVGFAWRPARDLLRLLANGVPPDEVLADSARAVFEAMRASGILDSGVPDSALRIADRAGEVTTWLEGVGTAEAGLYAESIQELLAPVIDQRWLIERTDGRLPWWMSFGLARIIRAVARRRSGPSTAAWLAVPSALARSEKRRGAFADAWARCVGGGRIVDARSAQGTIALAHARAISPSGRGTAEAWRAWS